MAGSSGAEPGVTGWSVARWLRGWHPETWFCSMRGHVAPAADVAVLADADANLGVDLPDGTRIVRCLRCDVWLRLPTPDPSSCTHATLPPLDPADLPLRGQALRDLIVLRAIAVERSLHVVLFASVALVALVVQLKLPAVLDAATDALDGLRQAVANTARGGGHRFLERELSDLADLRPGALWALIGVSAAYATLEAVEAVFLWRGRRWAEYLTVLATAGLLPLELWELAKGVSVLKALTLVVNLAILVWLVWHKRLFGLRGGAKAAEHPTDWAAVLASPLTADATGRLAPEVGAAPGSRPVGDRPVGDPPVGDR